MFLAADFRRFQW